MSLLLPPDRAGIARAAQALRAGELVVFPTETVYGLGAHALDAEAVAKVFAAKGRPPDNPLIVHVADAAAARALAAAWSEEAEALARAFWPGPLTLVVPRGERVPDATTAGLDSVALRVPAHGVARHLLAAAGLPVAAPSANRSGRPSPTRVADARADLGDAVAVYLDGGPTEVGVESTVVSLVGDRPAVLREGGVPREAVGGVVGALAEAPAEERHRSPGTRHRHYAPRARVRLVPDGAQARRLLAGLRLAGRRCALVAPREDAEPGADTYVPGPRADAAAWARAIFALLRDLDERGYDDVVVVAIPEAGLGRAVMDRLRRAAEGEEGGGTA